MFALTNELMFVLIYTTIKKHMLNTTFVLSNRWCHRWTNVCCNICFHTWIGDLCFNKWGHRLTNANCNKCNCGQACVLGDAQGQSVDAHTINRDVLSPIVIDV
jgi:hypothetical protein